MSLPSLLKIFIYYYVNILHSHWKNIKLFGFVLIEFLKNKKWEFIEATCQSSVLN